jgi:hypothetical protein
MIYPPQKKLKKGHREPQIKDPSSINQVQKNLTIRRSSSHQPNTYCYIIRPKLKIKNKKSIAHLDCNHPCIFLANSFE